MKLFVTINKTKSLFVLPDSSVSSSMTIQDCISEMANQFEFDSKAALLNIRHSSSGSLYAIDSDLRVKDANLDGCEVVISFPTSTQSIGKSLIGAQDAEYAARVKLAAMYRIFDHFGWTELIYNHISLAVPGTDNQHYFLNPFGLQFNEITASSLVIMDIEGNVVDNGSTDYALNKPGIALHGAFHRHRAQNPDAFPYECVAHMHSVPCTAVSSMKCGLLPMNQIAMIVGSVSYHPYQGLDLDTVEQQELIDNLGDNRVMLLRNHGALTLGKTVGEAFYLMYMLDKACEIQVETLAAVGGDLKNVTSVDQEVVDGVVELTKGFGEEGGGFGHLEFEAMLRMLDEKDPSYRD